MKRLLQYCILIVLAGGAAMAQDGEKDTTYWKNAFQGGINLNQAAFSSNWSAGGINSIGVNAYINFKAKYKKDRNSWDNEIDMLYGFVNNEGQGYRKTNDRIFLDTKYGYALNSKWNVVAAANFLSQFAKGYRYEEDADGIEQEILISDFLTPGYLTLGLGFEYKPVDYFSLRISPISPRFTFVTNEDVLTNVSGRYGVDPGKNVRTEWAAAQLIADFDKDLTENLNLKWRYILFANYQNLGFDNLDHRLDAILSAKVWKYIDVNLNFIMLYDKDQDDDIQLSQALGIGFVYSKKNYKDE